jgi:putative oxidoreductase
MKLFKYDYPDHIRDFGLLLIRLGIGGMFVWAHGSGKIFGGPETWEKLGGAMADLGLDFWPTFWGFMAAFAEFGGGLLLILGFLFRPACFLLFFTMLVATFHHFMEGDSIKTASHAIEAGTLFLGLWFVGPGPYSLDYLVFVA